MFPIQLQSVLAAILIIVLFGYRWYKNHFNYWAKYSVIPSVPGRIFSGSIKDILSFKTNIGFLMKTIYDDEKFQNEAVVGIYTLQEALLIRDPDLIKSILIRDFNCFRNRFSSSDPHHDPIGALSLFLCRYDVWKELRTKMSSIFTSGKIKQMYPLIQQVGENLEKYLHKKGDRFVCELKELAFLFATDITATTTFGIGSNSLENPEEEVHLRAREIALFNLKRALNFMVLSMMPRFGGFFKATFFFPKTSEFSRRATKIAVQQREKSGIKRNDMIDAFVKIKNESLAKGDKLSEVMDLIAAQIAVFMGGGTETSSSTIANVLLEIAKKPDIQKRLRQEILLAFARGNGAISYEDICEMEYLSMVIDETLRMYPVFPFLERQYLKPNAKSGDYSLRPFYDFNIPQGMPVYISVFGLHYDPKFWPEPTKFNPERFTPENKKSLNPTIYLPFGGGPRNCIGARLGDLQVKTCIVHILKNHCVQLCSETNLKTEFNTKAFILQTKGGIHLEIVKDDLYRRSVS